MRICMCGCAGGYVWYHLKTELKRVRFHSWEHPRTATLCFSRCTKRTLCVSEERNHMQTKTNWLSKGRDYGCYPCVDLVDNKRQIDEWIIAVCPRVDGQPINVLIEQYWLLSRGGPKDSVWSAWRCHDMKALSILLAVGEVNHQSVKRRFDVFVVYPEQYVKKQTSFRRYEAPWCSFVHATALPWYRQDLAWSN